MRHIKVIFIIICLIVLSGCISSNETVKLKSTETGKVNTLNDVHLEIVENTLSSEGLTLLIVNESDKTLTYNGSFFLEKKIDGNWYEVNDILGGKFGFDDEGLGTNAQETTELEIEWDWLYGNLNAGKYRLIKDVLVFRESGGFDNHSLAVEFELTE